MDQKQRTCSMASIIAPFDLTPLNYFLWEICQRHCVFSTTHDNMIARIITTLKYISPEILKRAVDHLIHRIRRIHCVVKSKDKTFIVMERHTFYFTMNL